MSHKKQQSIPVPKQKGSLWLDLTNLHAQCVSMSHVPGEVSTLLRNQALVAEIGDTTELEKLGQLLVKDIKDFQAQLDRIFAQHRDKHGACNDPDQWMEAIRINELYLSWIDSWQNTVPPTVAQILAIGKKAADAIEARQAQQTPPATQDSLAF